MTASIKEREDKLCDRKTTSKTKKLLENKEEQLNQLKETLEAVKRTKTEPRERQVEKDEDGIVFDRDALMDVTDWPSVLSRTAGEEEVIARRLSKPADKT